MWRTLQRAAADFSLPSATFLNCQYSTRTGHYSLRIIPVTPATNSVASSQPSRIWTQRNQRRNRGDVPKRLKRDGGSFRSTGASSPTQISRRSSHRNRRGQAFARPALLIHFPFRGGEAPGSGLGCHFSACPSFTRGTEFSTEYASGANVSSRLGVCPSGLNSLLASFSVGTM